jgi:hypothetical protein
VSGPRRGLPATVYENLSRAPIILGLALLSIAIYTILALAGDLRSNVPAYLVGHAVLTVGMLAAWARTRKDPARLGVILAAALLFRIVASLGAPALSDDVYRYVWDGRVQLHGFHPYRHAPADPELESLRDDDWKRINHPELQTIYPPLAQIFFLGLAALGAGPVGFKLALGLVDFAVILALARLARGTGLPPDRLVLYAWNPLAVMETAGSGHVEPLGILLAVAAAAWIIGRRPYLSTAALAGSIAVKLVPLLLVPGYVRRFRAIELLLLVALLAAVWAPYAASGPAIGAGLFEYAERWEFNSFAYAGVHGALVVERFQERLGEGLIPWDFLYRHVWPDDVARILMLLAASAWVIWLTFRPSLDAARESYLVLAGAVLLSPTVHPWYVLWVLPFAAIYRAPGWLTFAALVPLSYLATSSSVPWPIRWVQYLPLLTLLAFESWRRWHRKPLPEMAGPGAGDSGATTG